MDISLDNDCGQSTESTPLCKITDIIFQLVTVSNINDIKTQNTHYFLCTCQVS